MRKNKRLLLKTFFALQFLLVINWTQAQVKLAVASSARQAVMTLADIYQLQNQGRSIQVVSGSTGKLVSQIENGAPYHILFSASTDFADYLKTKGLVSKGPQVYAEGSLIMWTASDGMDLSGSIDDILAGIDKLAIASSRKAPYGKLAKSFLDEQGFSDKYRDKIILGASVSQINQYIVSGSADACLTAKSTVFDPKNKNRGSWVDIPDTSIEQAILITDYAVQHNYEAALDFYNFVFSETGRKILIKAGYQVLK